MPREAGVAEITFHLKRLRAGDDSAETPLAEAVYGRMRELARGVLHRQGASDSVQATALANEVLLELVRLRSIEWQDRIHFFRVAGRLMRRRFLDHIRESRAAKRAPEGKLIQLNDGILAPKEERFDEILWVDKGLERLAEFDSGLAEAVELVYFGGFTIAEVAAVRSVSEKTIDRHLDLARRWMAVELGSPCPSLLKTSATSGEG